MVQAAPDEPAFRPYERKAIYTFCVIPTLAHLDWYRFLGRAPLPPPSAHLLNALRGERILVTGGGGFIGSALALCLAGLQPEQMIALESSESRLFALQNELSRRNVDAARTAFVLGSVNDAPLLQDVFVEHEPTLVFHAAAFKHVPILEAQPLAAIENNIFGTSEVLKAAARHDARCVLLSTDKAVNPVSVLGATKRVAEMLTLAQGGIVVRLANVLASSDSVSEIFARQIAEGDALTVTAPNARRYFLTPDEAVHLLLTATGHAGDSSLFAPDLKQAHSIPDLAKYLIAEFATPPDARIEYTQLRPGEKESEMLWSIEESAAPLDGAGLVALTSVRADSDALTYGLKRLRAACHERDVAAAIDALRFLMPGYMPTNAVLDLARQAKSGVTP